MKVVYGSKIFDEMKDIIRDAKSDGRKIIRVEMSVDEFLQLLKDIYMHEIVDEGLFDKICAPEYFTERTINGSYVVYKGVCFQAHEDYE